MQSTMIPLSQLKQSYPDYCSSNIFVYDDVFPAWQVADHARQLQLIQWEYGHMTDATKLGEYDRFFGRQLFHLAQNHSENMPPVVTNIAAAIEGALCHNIDKDGEFRGIYRVSLNGQTKGMRPGPHVDTVEKNYHWTAVYFANEADGDLQFYDNIKDLNPTDCVDFKLGRIVIFPSGYAHEALAPTTPWRVSIGIMFEHKTDRQYKILKEEDLQDAESD